MDADEQKHVAVCEVCGQNFDLRKQSHLIHHGGSEDHEPCSVIQSRRNYTPSNKSRVVFISVAYLI